MTRNDIEEGRTRSRVDFGRNLSTFDVLGTTKRFTTNVL